MPQLLKANLAANYDLLDFKVTPLPIINCANGELSLTGRRGRAALPARLKHSPVAAVNTARASARPGRSPLGRESWVNSRPRGLRQPLASAPPHGFPCSETPGLRATCPCFRPFQHCHDANFRRTRCHSTFTARPNMKFRMDKILRRSDFSDLYPAIKPPANKSVSGDVAEIDSCKLTMLALILISEP